MEHLFCLLNPTNLEKALHNQNLSLVVDFARFLAAYYLNLPQIWCSKNNSLPLPNLFEWVDTVESGEFLSNSAVDYRGKLASLLPHEYSPYTALQLLCQTGHWSEGLLLADHFNDLKSQLILRHLLDQNHNLDLVNEHCQQCLVDALLKDIKDFCAEDSSQEMTARIRTIAGVVIKLDVVFHLDLLNQMMQKAMNIMQEELKQLLGQEVDPLVQLPRPPIFAMPSEYCGEIFELLSWNKVFHLLQVLITNFSVSNQLHPLIARSFIWLSTINPHCNPEQSHFLESELDEYEDTSQEYLQLFDKIIVVTLKVSLRDRMCLLTRTKQPFEDERNSEDSELHYLQSKYVALLPKESEKKESKILQRWLEDWADDSDFDFLMTFLKYLQENNPRTERYLPPLTHKTHQQWSSVLLAHLGHSQKHTATTSLIANDKKIKINSAEWLKLQFLAQHLPPMLLFDPTLIQISLKLDPAHLALPIENVLSEHIVHLQEEIPEAIQGPFIDKPNKPKPTGHNLLADIRASISRLSSMQHQQRPAIDQPLEQGKDEFDVLLQDFQLHKMQHEIEEEKTFLKEHCTEPLFSGVGNTRVFGQFRRLDIQSRLDLLNRHKQADRVTLMKSSSESRITSTASNSSLREEIEKISRRLSKIQKNFEIEGSKSKRSSNRSYSTRYSGKSGKRKMQTSIQSNRSSNSGSEKLESAISSAGYYSSDDKSSKVVSLPHKVEKEREKTEKNLLPLQPAASFRLDFSALHSSPERQKKILKHKQWTDLEIYERQESSGPQRSQPNKSVPCKASPEAKSKSSVTEVKSEQKCKYPEWLRLLPAEHKSNHSSRFGPKSEPRLLWLPSKELKEEWINSKNKSARDENSSRQQGMVRYDSGFIDQPNQREAKTKEECFVEAAGGVLFTCEMSQDQIDELLNAYNNKHFKNCYPLLNLFNNIDIR